MNTHYGVIVYSGDFGGEVHPDLQGSGPTMTLIAVGPEQFCWSSLDSWTRNHPLRPGEEAEVLRRTL